MKSPGSGFEQKSKDTISLFYSCGSVHKLNCMDTIFTGNGGMNNGKI